LLVAKISASSPLGLTEYCMASEIAKQHIGAGMWISIDPQKVHMECPRRNNAKVGSTHKILHRISVENSVDNIPGT
jgi:hypothetical protein